MTHARITRVSLSLASFFLFLPAASSLWAQADQWDKHMKAGSKAYGHGMNEKYFHSFFGANSPPALRDFAKAEQEFLAALAQTKTFPAGDLRAAETLGDLASVYSQEGKFAEAESRGNQAIAIIEASAGPNDPRLGYALIPLALIYDSESKFDQAAPIWKRSLAILQKAGGPPDPEERATLGTLSMMADFDTKRDARKQIYQYIVDLREATGVSDTDLRKALLSLASVQHGSDAEPDYIRILEIDKRVYGPEDPTTSYDEELLAKVYADDGKYAAALPLLQHSLEVAQKKAAPAHDTKYAKSSDTYSLLRLKRELAKAYVGTGKDSEAEELYKWLVSMDEPQSNPDHALNAMSLTEDLRGLSRVYRDEHRYAEAIDALKQSETVDDEIANSKFGKSRDMSIWLWWSQNDLAETYRQKGDIAAAEPLFQRSLEMSGTLQLVPGNPSLAELLDNYATLLRDEGKYDEAESLYKRALDTWAKWAYPERADVAVTLTDYAVLLRKVNRPAEAEPLEARASAIRAKTGAPTPAK